MRRLLALAALAAAPALGQEARWYLQVDNDVVFASDRWYTSGVRLARVAPRGGHDLEWGLVQEIYTPDPVQFAPGRPDRSPTARLLLSVARHERREGLFRTLELQGGVRGPSALGEESTDAIHRVIAAREVDWSRQQGDRVDLSAAFTDTRSWRFLNGHYGAVLGNQVAHLHAGAELRLGRSGAHAVSTPLLRFAATPPLAAGPDAHGWTFFLGGSVRAVLRNEMLERNHDPGGPDLKLRRGVARAVAGIAWSTSWGAVVYAVTAETREFDGQHTPQEYGSVALHLAF